MKPKFFSLLLILSLMLSVSTSAFAQGDDPLPDRFSERELPVSVSEQRLDQPLELSNFDIDSIGSPVFATGQERVIIRLVNESVSEQKLRGKSAQQAKKQIETEQDDLLSRVLNIDPSARIIAKVQVVLNAVFVEVDASLLPVIASDPAVLRVIPVRDYELDLAETVPYIGSTTVQESGYDGTGIRVAVLDSGIDYLHAAFGGSGDPAIFAANDPAIIEPGTFPTAKVVGGYDFVGGLWTGGAGSPAEAPDPDPLDAGAGGGHGTHVAHIIGGAGGVAPGVDLYAVKVCSSISTSCSGIALIQGMEFAVDPDGDGDPSDHVDVINMSLGSNYGNPYDDDLSLAVNNATDVGVLTVAASGNGSDKPYISGTPAAAETAISVAQTSVPSATLPRIEVLSPPSIAGLYDAVHQAWSAPLDMLLEGALQYGDGAGGNLLGCSTGADPNSAAPGTEPYATGSLAGKIVLVDRGVCNFSIKIYNIQRGGGIAGIIGLVTSEAPFSGAFGAGGPFTIPGFMISQVNSNIFKSGLSAGVILRLDPANGIPLIGTVVGSSSRGPSNNVNNLLKPEIGAPGASVSAVAGTGTGEAAFGGTSGATPMVAGSAALLMQAKPGFSPLEVKAQLMNTAFTDVLNSGAGPLAPISRIGGGEVRVDWAFSAPAAAWDDGLPTGALSFGFIDVSKDTVSFQKTVRVRNYSNQDITYYVTPSFRYLEDESSGAVSISAPQKVKVKAGKDTTFSVKLTINGALLPANFMNSGTNGANPASLTLNEFDGYLTLDDGTQPIHLAWHVLPRKAADVVGRTGLDFEAGMDVVDLTNIGVGTAQNDAYSLLALSPDIPEGPMGGQAPTPDIRGVGINTFPVPAGYCSANPSFIWAFAVNTWERQVHLMPVTHQILLDTNTDGTTDYIVLNRDYSGFGTISDGRQLAYAYNVATGTASAYFFAEHATNTGNTALYICAEQIGMGWDDLLATNVDMAVYTQDFYFGGDGDLVEGLTVTPYGERFYGIPEDISGKSEGLLTVYDFGPWSGNTPELGLMMFTNGDRGAGNRGGAIQETEALFFLAP